MKLSIETKAILKNFEKFQPGLIIQPGNVLKFRTAAVYAEATVAETFPTEVRISNLQDFLHMVDLFKDAQFDFTKERIRIAEADGTAELVYPQAKPGSPILLPLPKALKSLPAENVTFTICAEQWMTIQKALGVLTPKKKDHWQRRNLTIASDGKAVRLTAERGFNSAGYSVTVATHTNGPEFKSVIGSDYPLMVAGPYQITATPEYIIFQHTGSYNLRYFVGLDTTLSTWGDQKSYLVTVTKSMVQDCQHSVLAHSAEEAEAIVRQKPDGEFRWTAEPRIRKDFKAVE